MDILKGPNKTVKETQSLILRIDRWRSKHLSLIHISEPTRH